MIKTRPQSTSYQKGLWAESIGLLYLRVKGHRLKAKRYKTAFGEIDLVTETKNYIVFTEVKFRPNHETAAHAISEKQKERLRHAALHYLQKSPTEKMVRFDVLLVNERQFPLHLKNVIWSD